MAKELFDVRGKKLTERENAIYQVLVNSDKAVSYKDIDIADMTDKVKISLLARLESTHGLLKKNQARKGTFYKVNVEKLQSVDLSKITDKEKSVLESVKALEGLFNYKDVASDTLNDKAKIATLARLNTTYGVLDKVTESNVTTYEIVD